MPKHSTHAHPFAHTYVHTHIRPTHMLSSVIIVMNGLSRQLALSTICHACDAPSAPLLVRYTAQFEKERDTERERERQAADVEGGEQLAGDGGVS